MISHPQTQELLERQKVKRNSSGADIIIAIVIGVVTGIAFPSPNAFKYQLFIIMGVYVTGLLRGRYIALHP